MIHISPSLNVLLAFCTDLFLFDLEFLLLLRIWALVLQLWSNSISDREKKVCVVLSGAVLLYRNFFAILVEVNLF